ncbi:MICOS complex subunit MIC13 homolog QIL1 [Drosophila montana]|uniref:MICOS complex subunit MIC13 homolog QIL1 n=1 Tax=Drosophila montana TaxID=40370 RepID=UPI00313BEC05
MFSTLMARTAAITVAIYFTNRVGVWGNTETADQLYQRLAKGLEPMRQLLPVKLPAQSELSLRARQYYDRGIKEGIQLMRQLPNYAGQLLELARIGLNKQPTDDTDDEYTWPPVTSVAVDSEVAAVTAASKQQK